MHDALPRDIGQLVQHLAGIRESVAAIRDHLEANVVQYVLLLGATIGAVSGVVQFALGRLFAGGRRSPADETA